MLYVTNINLSDKNKYVRLVRQNQIRYTCQTKTKTLDLSDKKKYVRIVRQKQILDTC